MMFKKSPGAIKIGMARYYKEVVPWKYKTREGLYGYHGSYITYDFGNTKKVLFEAIELSEWQLEQAMSEMVARFIENDHKTMMDVR